MSTDSFIGYTMGLGCALGWSMAIILFKRSGEHIHPVLLNLFKNTLGLVLFIPTLWLTEGTLWFDVPGRDLALLCLSGFLGIGIADYFVLRALSFMGASRLAVVECLYSPFVIILSMVYLGEAFTATRGVGTLLVIAAIVSVTYRGAISPMQGERVVAGASWGAVGLLIMAGGIVIMKPMFATLPLMLIITIRLAAGVVASWGAYMVTPNRKQHLRRAMMTTSRYTVVIASFLSTYVSMLMWVAGFKYNDAMVAAVLNQTSTIFTVLLAVWILKEKLTVPKMVGTALAFAGVIVMSI